MKAFFEKLGSLLMARNLRPLDPKEAQNELEQAFRDDLDDVLDKFTPVSLLELHNTSLTNLIVGLEERIVLALRTEEATNLHPTISSIREGINKRFDLFLEKVLDKFVTRDLLEHDVRVALKTDAATFGGNLIQFKRLLEERITDSLQQANAHTDNVLSELRAYVDEQIEERKLVNIGNSKRIARVEGLQKELDVVRSRCEDLNARLIERENEIEALHDRLETLENRCNTFGARIHDVEHEHAQTKTSVDLLSAEVVDGDFTPHQNKIDQLSVDLNATRVSLRTHRDFVNGEIERIFNRLTDLDNATKNNLAALQDGFKEHEKLIRANEHATSWCREKIDENRGIITELDLQREEQRQNLINSIDNLRKLSDRFEEHEKHLTSAREEIERFRIFRDKILNTSAHESECQGTLQNFRELRRNEVSFRSIHHRLEAIEARLAQASRSEREDEIVQLMRERLEELSNEEYEAREMLPFSNEREIRGEEISYLLHLIRTNAKPDREV